MRTVYGTCHHDCPDSCGWIVTVDDSGLTPTAVKLRGNPDHPFSQGELCPKVNRYLERVYSPERITTPLKRIGPKGSGEYTPITWAEALNEIRERWNEIIGEHTAEAIVPFASAGNQSLLALTAHQRFIAELGTSRTHDSVCGVVAAVGTMLTYGTGRAADPVELVHAKCVVLWGTNTRLTNRHLWPFVEQARASGATIIVIDPLRTITADSADWFIQPLPGTDVALMLGLINQWIQNDRIDHDYVQQHAEGYDLLAEEAANWKPARVAEVCGIPPTEVVRLAAAIADAPPAHFRTVIGAEHREQGGTFFQVLAMLPVLLGSWRHRGGGYSRSTGVYSEGALGSIHEQSTMPPHRTRALTVNHISRWLNTPPAPEHEGDPVIPVQSMLIWGANPVVTFPNSEEIRRGLSRQDLFTVVHEQFMTDTAKYADIILPATTQLESADVVPSWGSMHIGWNDAAIPPVGECVSNSELFRRLAGAMGFDDPEFAETDEELLGRAFATGTDLLGDVTLESIRETHVARVALPDDYRPYANGGFGTPSGKARLASPKSAPTYIAASEGPHGEIAARFPLMLMTPKVHTRFLNGSYAHLPNHGGKEGGPYVELCESDAKERGIVDGELVVVHNDRASLTLKVRIGDTVRPGLVSVPFGWHGDGHLDGRAANALTNDTLGNLNLGVAYLDTMVQVSKL